MVRKLIEVLSIPHADQRMPTWGDWQWDAQYPQLQVKMSELSDLRYMFLGAIHEIIEAFICHYNGIAESAVDAFDEDYERRRVAGEKYAACGCTITNDPGMDPHAPYLAAHMVATQVEYGLAQVVGVDAATYDKACAAETEPFEAALQEKLK